MSMHILLMILMEKKLLQLFRKKNFKKQIKKNLELKKYSKEKAINYISKEKNIIIRLINLYMQLLKWECFSKSYCGFSKYL